ncbi:enoyl-CoA hydratase [Gordonia spumicola]|uniref:Enoyl-CoA hydratase n=1 Tax=Gordonia spumicola TaxID=589161 RepID=A0A7I9V8N9_9ACTN|nr:enoyl-CoA hydratase [Gordonia spumicola]GEE01687.1 enoyl-CoA hydratase [Gordonia spumicola]
MLLTETADRVRTITLNRPESRNALTPRLVAEIQAAFAAADDDPDVAVIVLTGSDPAFCAGVDLRVIGAEGGWDNMGSPPGSAAGDAPIGHPWTPISKPVIGAINGPAVTGGLELALACDILIASDRARFADTHARVGMMPLWGLTARLPEAVGFGFARRMSLTGNFVDAPTALAHGLVTDVVPHDELLPAAHALASDIASNNAAAVESILGSYRRVQDVALAPQVSIETETATTWLAGDAGTRIAADADAVIERGRSQSRR